eukprot:Gb_41556 [translate_table: standard]
MKSLLSHWVGVSSISTSFTSKHTKLLGYACSVCSVSSSSGDCTVEPPESTSSIHPNDGQLDVNHIGNILNIPWLSEQPTTSKQDYHKIYSAPYRKQYESMSLRRKEQARERKKRRVLRNMQERRFGQLIKTYGKRLGAEVTLDILGKLGRENGVGEYTAMIELCIRKAEETMNEEDALKQVCTAFGFLDKMRERGLVPDKFSYKPLLAYVANRGMAEEFQYLVEQMKEDTVEFSEDLSYYEMILWIKAGNREKVLELCNAVDQEGAKHRCTLAATFLLALSENDRTDELLGLLEKIEISQISSLVCLTNIFKCLGRATLQEAAEKCILAFKSEGIKQDRLSDFVCNYALNVRNMELEKILSIFKRMHEKLEVQPSSSSYNKLIGYCCETFEVHIALDLFEDMCKQGLAISADTFHPIMRASERSNELDLILPTYSVMRNHGVKPTGEIFKHVINSFIKMKNFEAAYNVLDEMKGLNMRPTVNLYNAIMAGYFREKNNRRGLAVLEQMKDADVKPDGETFSYLISYAESEEKAVKYYEEMQRLAIPASKYAYMGLINVFVSCGHLHKAKEIVKDQRIQEKYLNEVKSALVSALASNGKVSEALEIYDEIKQAGGIPEPKAIKFLIESLGMQGKFSEMFQLLNECKDDEDWCSACSRIVLSCIEHEQLSSAIDFLQQLKERDESLVNIVCDQIFCLISETAQPNLEDAFVLLEAMRKKMKVRPSRTGLDFLLSACVGMKDSYSAKLIGQEYIKEELSFNVLTLLRIFQVLLASGEHEDAALVLKRITRNDLRDQHVRYIIKMYVKLYQVPPDNIPLLTEGINLD